eukprot:2731185-Pleurochrysis_carterae.AAC.2
MKRRRAPLQSREQEETLQLSRRAARPRPHSHDNNRRTKVPRVAFTSEESLTPLTAPMLPKPSRVTEPQLPLSPCTGLVHEDAPSAVEWELTPAAVPSHHVQLQRGNASSSATDAEPITVLLGKLSLERYASRFIVQGCVAASKALVFIIVRLGALCSLCGRGIDEKKPRNHDSHLHGIMILICTAPSTILREGAEKDGCCTKKSRICGR